jgi:hypothetical protein
MLNRIDIRPDLLSHTLRITGRRPCAPFSLFLQLQTSPARVQDLAERLLATLNGENEGFEEREEHHRLRVTPRSAQVELFLGPGMDPGSTRGAMPTLELYGYLGKWLAKRDELSALRRGGELPPKCAKEVRLLAHLRRARDFRCVLSKNLREAARYVSEHGDGLRSDRYGVIHLDLYAGGDTPCGVLFRENRFCRGVLTLTPDPEAGPGHFTEAHGEAAAQFALTHRALDTLLVADGLPLLADYLVPLLGGDVSPYAPEWLEGGRPRYRGLAQEIQTAMEAVLTRRGVSLPGGDGKGRG